MVGDLTSERIGRAIIGYSDLASALDELGLTQ
jgi:hypothetical protein